MGWFGELFWGFQRFQLLFSEFFQFLGWVWGAVLGISAVSAAFFQNFSSFWAGLGSCFRNFSSFSYFFPEFFQFLGWIWELFWEFQQFQLLFPRIFPDFGLRLGAVLEVLGISAPSFAYYAINQSFCANVCHDRSISIFCDVLKNIALSVKSGNIIIKCQYLTHKQIKISVYVSF